MIRSLKVTEDSEIKVGMAVKIHGTGSRHDGQLAEVIGLFGSYAQVKYGNIELPGNKVQVFDPVIPMKCLTVDKEATEKLRKGGGVIRR